MLSQRGLQTLTLLLKYSDGFFSLGLIEAALSDAFHSQRSFPGRLGRKVANRPIQSMS